MIILQDTREQKPLKFKHPWVTEVKVRKLDVGDYGAIFGEEYEPPIYFERKSIPDLFGTFGKGYERFKKEIIRTQEAGKTLFIIVEGSLTDVFKGAKYSKLKGVSVVKKAFTIWIRYGVQTIFVNDRKEMSDYIVEFYIAAGKEWVRKKKD